MNETTLPRASLVVGNFPIREIAAGAAFVLILAMWPGVFLLDDAYITLANARTLLGGTDPYGAHPLVGATSAVHLALIAFLGLFIPLPWASAVISSAAVVLYGAGLVALARAAGCSGWRLCAIVCIGLLIGYQPLHYFNGLETGVAMAAVAWSLALANNRWLPLLCGVMPFIRPELAFLAAPLFFRRLYLTRDFTWSIGVAIAAAAPFALWYLLETGLPFPNTGGAKIAFFAEHNSPLSARVWWAVRAIAASQLLPLMIGLLILFRVPAGWCIAVFFTVWLGVVVITFPGSLTHNYYRYLALAVPALCYPLASLLARPERAASLLAAILIGWTVCTLALVLPLIPASVRGAGEGQAVSLFVNNNVPRGSTVLIHDAGWMGWINPELHLVDVVGLKTPASTTAHRQFTKSACAWGRALDHIASESRATYLVAIKGDGFWSCVATNLQDQGWSLTPLRWHGSYEVYRIYRAAQGRH